MKLGDVATYVNGYAFKPSDYSADGLPIIRIQNLTGNVCETNRFSGTLPEKFKVANDDILISWSASLGVYRWSHGDAWLNQHIFKVVFDKLPVNVDFFVYQAGYLIENSANLAHGATMRHLTKKVFDSRPFYYPSSAIQARIARNLASIDVLLGSLRCQLSALDDLVKSQFVETFGDPIHNEKGYPEQRLGELLDIARGGSPRPIKDYLTDDPRGINWIKIGDTAEGSRYINSTAEIIRPEGKAKSREVKAGDFLLSNSMSFGRPYILNIDGCIHDGWLVLSDNKKRFNKIFLCELLCSSALKAKFAASVRGGVVNNLNIDLVANTVVPYPPLTLQQEFADFVAEVDKLGFKQSLCSRATVSTSMQGVMQYYPQAIP